MATAADVKIAYRAMNRTDLNDTIAQATADAINNGTTTLDAYIASELVKNVATTQAAVAIAAFVTGVTPTSDKLDALKVSADAQVAAYTAAGSLHPELGAYEAFGVGFSSTSEFSAKYDGLSDTDFINAVYAAVFGVGPSAGAFANLASQITYFENLYTANGINAALAATQARGAVLGQIVGYAFVTASSADSLLDNQVGAALTAAAHGDTSIYGVPLAIDTTGQTFTLTQGTDAGAAFTGGAQNDTFNASVEQTALLPIQTLNNTDDLDGGGGRNVLNAQLVNAFTIPLGLTNIQVVNIDGAPGFIVPPVTLDVINANAIDELNIRAPANDVTINNLTTALKTLGLADDAGGNDFTVNHTGSATDGTADALDIKLSNSSAGSAININFAGGGANQGYETVTIHSTGGLGNAVAISSNHGPETVNIEGDANLNLNGSGILDVATLHTVEAGTFTGDLTATFTGTGAVSVNSGSGDDTLTFGGGVAATANGGLGNDHFIFLSGAGGNASFTTADSVNGGDGDDSLTIFHTGAGVFLAPGVGAGIVGIETIVHEGDIALAGNDLTVDMAESGSATKLLLQGDYDLGSITTVNNLTDADTVIINAGFNVTSQLNLNVANPGAALNITHLELTGGQTVSDLNTSLGTELLDLKSNNSMGVGGNAISDVADVDHNIMVSGDGNLTLGSTGFYGFFGGQIDASTFTGDLTATIGGFGGSDIIVTAGLGNDLIIINDFSSPGNADNIDISIGGSDTVRFGVATINAGNPLTLASDSYHHVTGFDVANDKIQFDKDGAQGTLENTLGTAITGPVTLNILNVANGQFADGTTAGYNFIKFTTAVNTAGDTGTTAFHEAIGNGAIEVANGGVDEIMGSFYDATNSQMVLFTVDANSAIADANPTLPGIQPGITQGDDIDIVGTVGMSYDAYLAFNGTNFGFVA